MAASVPLPVLSWCRRMAFLPLSLWWLQTRIATLWVQPCPPSTPNTHILVWGASMSEAWGSLLKLLKFSPWCFHLVFEGSMAVAAARGPASRPAGLHIWPPTLCSIARSSP